MSYCLVYVLLLLVCAVALVVVLLPGVNMYPFLLSCALSFSAFYCGGTRGGGGSGYGRFLPLWCGRLCFRLAASSACFRLFPCRSCVFVVSLGLQLRLAWVCPCLLVPSLLSLSLCLWAP